MAGARDAAKKAFIAEVAGLLDQSGYEETTAAEFDRLRGGRKPIYSRQYRLGENIYGRPWRGNFILYHPEQYPECLAIEVRWQTVSGTTEQKFPLFVLTIKARRHPSYPVVLVIGGDGFSRGAVKWLRARADKRKLRAVLDPAEFERLWERGGV